MTKASESRPLPLNDFYSRMHAMGTSNMLHDCMSALRDCGPMQMCGGSHTVLLFPLGQTTNVPWTSLGCSPQIPRQRQEVEEEEEADGPFERRTARSDHITLCASE